MANDGDNIVVNTKGRGKKSAGEDVGAGNKRKVSVVVHQNGDHDNTSPTKRRKAEEEADLDTSRPTALFKPTRARDWTVSIALPGSWLNNAKRPDHKTMQVGRIARAAAVFCVDEIVVYDDDPMNIDPKIVSPKYLKGKKGRKTKPSKQEILSTILEDDEPWQNPDQFLYHVLTYAECPPNLRTTLFAKHKNLEQAGILPSMDMPHHLRSHEWCQFREGSVTGPAPSPNGDDDDMQYAYIDCGLPFPIRVPIPTTSPVESGMRTTIRFTSPSPPPSWPHLSQTECEDLDAVACPNTLPRSDGGYYWGYTTRRATSLSAVFQESEFADGYDYTIGTSERGVPLQSILPGNTYPAHNPVLPKTFEHLLIVFGGVAGIEVAVANDPVLVEKGLGKKSARDLFDAWVNLVPGQGSRTIRTEEAVEFGLCGLKAWVDGRYEG